MYTTMKHADVARMSALVLLNPAPSAVSRTIAVSPSATSGRRGTLWCASPPSQAGSARSRASAAASLAVAPT